MAKEDEVVSAIVQEVCEDDPVEVEKIYNRSAIKVLLVRRLLKSLESLRNLLLQ